jgi:hypothetical protein
MTNFVFKSFATGLLIAKLEFKHRL